jgi:hypothetical protein
MILFRIGFGIPFWPQIRFNMLAGRGGWHEWQKRFPLIFAVVLLEQ